MKGLPLSYAVRNLAVRRASTLFTALGVAMTVAVFAGVLSLREGFKAAYEVGGSDDIVIYLRKGSNSEGESGIIREQVEVLRKERPELALDEDGRPLAAGETFLAVYMEQRGGGLTNVPIRGIQPASLRLFGDRAQLLDGRWLEFGTDEVVVGRPLSERMLNCGLGDTLVLNTTPFLVVGVVDLDGAQGGEVWGDVERMMEALDRPVFQRVVAQVRPGTDIVAIKEELKDSERTPVKVMTEREYLAGQTSMFGDMLESLAMILTVVMGVAAVLGSMNTMIASVAARTHEIGVLLSVGFRRHAIFTTFLFESALIGLAGGLLGILFVLPFHGLETGAVNWSTFTDVSFSFQITLPLALRSFVLAFILGLIGGVLPAVRAARLRPVEALRES